MPDRELSILKQGPAVRKGEKYALVAVILYSSYDWPAYDSMV